ncbi:V-type ATP synthase subunit K [archaeon BMS3Abin16]|nr:V-type ATP synthase subunit K [archaeon BMS3Abin16]
MDRKLKVLAICMMLLFAVGTVAAQDAEQAVTGAGAGADGWKIALAAAFAIGVAALASAYGIAHAGSAAMAAMAEKPEIATWGVIIVALAEGLALYGLVIAFMLISKIPG